ncbi:hypothetical protein DFH07DRAFT_578665 [Mycena maculata]|uniref:GATA-type domain-containing protein n=1 Tax=Mycena maculata TaxID=230809 RepID=A0AAD7N641_9AGAR|nr:hypothetical protein DFH07DRAFT_578665 [Mycena maculata]
MDGRRLVGNDLFKCPLISCLRAIRWSTNAMSYNRPAFNSEYDPQRDAQGSSYSQWTAGSSYSSGPSWNDADATAPMHHHSSAQYAAGPEYPPTMYTQVGPPRQTRHVLNEARTHPEYPPYVDPRTAFIDQGNPYTDIPSHQSQSMPFNSAGSFQARIPNVTNPSWIGNTTPIPPSSQWPSMPYAPAPQTTVLPVASAPRNSPRHSAPSTAQNQIHLPESSPGDYSADGHGKICSHCGTTSTPLWRRDPRTHKALCNACGLYLHQRQQARPQSLIAVANDEAEAGDSDGEYAGPECGNCGTRKTSAWRRNKAGAQVCNACGVFERMNGRPRPLALRNDKIRPRSRHQEG